METLHVVSHTHWDREWYRPFQLFRLKLVHLIDGMLELLATDRNFKYFMLDGQTIVLDDYLAMRPEKEAVLRDYIRKGRIVIGPWHILPDMFLVDPEAHIRNLLQGDRTTRKFGPKMMIGYIPDPFGHPGQVPQILRGFGIETACLWRGLDEQPAEFWWQSPDGSRVLMAYLRDSYSNGASLPADNPALFASTLAAAGDALAAHSAVMDHLIMFGTDHMEPPVHSAAAIAYANKKLNGRRVVHSTLPQFVGAVRNTIKRQKLDLPVVTGELRDCKRMHLLPGVLSTRIWIKQRNQACETLLEKWAEPFSTFAALSRPARMPETAIQAPASLLQTTWRLLMENHPHDSICGCSVDQVHEEMKARFDQVEQVGEELTRQSLERLAASVKTDQMGAPSVVVVFNPDSSERTDGIEASFDLPAGVNEFDLVDETGSSLPYQQQGLGSRELVHSIFDARGFQSAFGMISDGRVSGMSVQALKVHREGSSVHIEAIMADGGEPNLSVWTAGKKQVDACLADPAVKSFEVLARSVSATHIVFNAAAVPGLGYKTYAIRPRPAKESAPLQLNPLVKLLLPLARLPFVQALANRRSPARPPYRIENDFLLVEAQRDGTLTVKDKTTGQTYPGLNRFVDGGDCGDEYNYAPPAADRFVSARLKRVFIDRNPVRQSLELELELDLPLTLAPDRKSRSREQVKLPVTTTVRLGQASPRLDIHTSVENSARDHRLRVHFPAPLAAQTSWHDGHFEVVERKIGTSAFDESWIEQPRPEVPQRAFTDISDGQVGLAIANRGLPEVEVMRNSDGTTGIALTLLRCVGWLSRDDFSTRKGHAGPFMETPGAQMQGTWSFDYSILPHRGDWHSACAQAYAFAAPLRAVSSDSHTGELPVSGAFLRVEPAEFVVSAVKRSEDGRGWLVRGYNLAADELRVSIKPWKVWKKVEQVNLAETKLAALKPGKDGSIQLPVGGHAIVNVLFHD